MTTNLKPTQPPPPKAILAAHGVTADAVLDRTLVALALKHDTELAGLFGISKTTFISSRRRNSILFEELVMIHVLGKVDIGYVLFGTSLAEEALRLAAESGQRLERFRALFKDMARRLAEERQR